MRAPSRLCQKLLEAVLPEPRGHHWSPKAKTPEDFRVPTVVYCEPCEPKKVDPVVLLCVLAIVFT